MIAGDAPPSVSRELGERLIKAPKLYPGDAGLAAHLAGVEDLALSAAPLRGPCSSPTLRIRWCRARGSLARARLGFWNIQGRHEVDFVVESGRDCLAIEVKAASRWTERDLAGLRAFPEHTPRCRTVASRVMWEMKMAHSSGWETTNQSPWRATTGGTRHGEGYQEAEAGA